MQPARHAATRPAVSGRWTLSARQHVNIMDPATLPSAQPTKEQLHAAMRQNALTLGAYFLVLRATPLVIDAVRAWFVTP